MRLRPRTYNRSSEHSELEEFVEHGQIDILRAELVNRLRENRPETGALIKGDDVQRLCELLAGRGESPTKPPS